jgi:hypothetical protein
MNLATIYNGQNPEGQYPGSLQGPDPDPGNEGKKLTVLSKYGTITRTGNFLLPVPIPGNVLF